jgi:ferredoxin
VRAKELVEVARVKSEQCVGCGLCVAHCPEEALVLVRRETTHEPPQDYAAWLAKVALEKGREEAFQAQLG